jgi:phospholipid transport system transporter-binding protein
MMQPESGRLLLTGHLTSETVPTIFSRGLQRLTHEDMSVDFSRVEGADSAAIGMLLAWLRAAEQSKHSLQIIGLPADLLSLATLYGVADFLPQSS